eukprot:78833-Pelagomonas_calceolata.AAC.6
MQSSVASSSHPYVAEDTSHVCHDIVINAHHRMIALEHHTVFKDTSFCSSSRYRISALVTKLAFKKAFTEGFLDQLPEKHYHSISAQFPNWSSI